METNNWELRSVLMIMVTKFTSRKLRSTGISIMTLYRYFQNNLVDSSRNLVYLGVKIVKVMNLSVI